MSNNPLTHHPRIFENTRIAYDSRFKVICNCGERRPFTTLDAAEKWKEAHEKLHPAFISDEIFAQRLEAIGLRLTHMTVEQLEIVRDLVTDHINAEEGE